jgi:hypothetical protein
MGRAGSKSRKTHKQPQHLPKVGTPKAEHYEQEQERNAVMGNFGVRKKGVGYWIVAAVVVVIVVFGMLTWIFVT